MLNATSTSDTNSSILSILKKDLLELFETVKKAVIAKAPAAILEIAAGKPDVAANVIIDTAQKIVGPELEKDFDAVQHVLVSALVKHQHRWKSKSKEKPEKD